MPKYLIERNIPGVGSMTGEQLAAASRKSCTTLSSIGPQIQWVQSYVTQDKLFCVYIAPDAETVKLHAEKSGFPANVITQIVTIIDPTTAEG